MGGSGSAKRIARRAARVQRGYTVNLPAGVVRDALVEDGFVAHAVRGWADGDEE
jgi:hypothetical protein